MSHKSCNMRTRDLPDISALALGRRAYISVKSLVPMLQLSHINTLYQLIYKFTQLKHLYVYSNKFSENDYLFIPCNYAVFQEIFILK